MYEDDTIAAISTASGRAGIGVIRISGKYSKDIAEKLCAGLPQPRVAKLTAFNDKQNKCIDRGLILYFPAPHSFTGESVVELHGHGGMIVLDQLLARVFELGARQARPGEFSLRAFLNDKIDLTQAEAVADLINASSQQAARAAIRSLEGEFSNKVNSLLEQLIDLRLYIESAIDFPEEEIDFISEQLVEERTQDLLNTVTNLIKNVDQGRLLRDGLIVVIVGKPNAGKSSLLNALAGTQSAIVTDIPGTTRDVIKEIINIDGLPLNIVDTAGLRDSNNPVEREGVRRAREQIDNADSILNVIDINEANDGFNEIHFENSHAKIINVFNKIDLTNTQSSMDTKIDQTNIYLSAKTGEGIELLREKLKQLAGYESDNEGVFIARRRHLNALNHAHKNILNGLGVLRETKAVELLAEELRYAQDVLNEITGEFSSDDLLDKIFRSFCIGK